MTYYKLGDVVRDVWENPPGRTGRVVAIDDINNRATVDFGTFKMTGCQSWFAKAEAEP